MAFKQTWKSTLSTIHRPYGAQVVARPRARQQARWSWGWVILSEGIIGAAVIVMAGLFLLYSSKLIFPGVHTVGVGLGGLSKQQAALALETAWQRQAITLYAGEKSFTASPEQLGISLDVQATVQAAFQQGRSLEALGKPVSPVLYFDSAIAQENLERLAPQLALPATSASVRIASGRAEAVPAVAGQALNLAATQSYLEQNLDQIIVQGSLPLIMSPIQPASSDVSALVNQANQLLAKPLEFHAYDPITNEALAWTVAPQTWGEWLLLSASLQDSTQLCWSVDTDKVKNFLAGQTAGLGYERYIDSEQAVAAFSNALSAQQVQVSLRIYHRPKQHIVQAGETLASIGRAYGIPYAWIQQANPDVSEALYAGQTLTIPSQDTFLPLPVVENKRIVVSIAQQKIWAYENGAIKWEWAVSTGISSSPSSPGIFQIRTHEPNAYAGNWDLWMPHFMGIYRPVPGSDFMNGFHGFPTRNGSQLLWTNSLGKPVTYGCILISTENAALLYEWAEDGTVVEIRSD